MPDSARRSRSPHPAASVGAAATPHLPARGRARTPGSSDSPRAGSRSLFPPPSAVPPHTALTCLGRGPWRRGAGGNEAGEEGGAALRARHRSTMAELGAGGDGHRGGDGAVRRETGDCTAGAGGGPAGGEAGAVSRRGGLAPGTGGPLVRRTAARNGRPRAPRTRTRSAPVLRPPPSAVRRPPGSAVPQFRGRPAGPSSGRPSYAPPRLSHNRWKLASERGREEELENAGRSPLTCRPGSNSVEWGNRIPQTKLPAGKSSARCDRQDYPFLAPSRLPRSNPVPGSQAPVAQ